MFTFSPKYTDCRYDVHQFRVSPRLGRAKSFLLAAYLARTNFSRFDILHTHGDNYLLADHHPQVRTFHGSARDEAASAVTLRRRLYQGIMTYLEVAGARVADVSVGVSEATRARIPAVTTIIPCGVDIKRFRPGKKNDIPAVLFVGTTGGRKRGGFLAEVFQQEIRTRFPDAELWMVAERPIDAKGIVNFGRVSEEKLILLFQKAWVFCLPSTYEGFGVPYIEALAAGTPVVASSNPGACEVLQNGKFGILAEDNELGKVIVSLLVDANERERFTTQGLIRAQDFSWPSVAERYEDIYNQLLSTTNIARAFLTS